MTEPQTPAEMLAPLMAATEQGREEWSGDVATCHCSACCFALEAVEQAAIQLVIAVLEAAEHPARRRRQLAMWRALASEAV